VDYALRLATYPGDLLAEELHKLRSLYEEIVALRGLGFVADEGNEHLGPALRRRLGRGPWG
jgi:hypothetical protein